MPEGPEIHRAAGALAGALLGEIAHTVELRLPGLERFERRLAGRRVVDVRARSKAITVGFEGGLHLYAHNQLYGKWFVRRTGNRPRTTRQLRALVENERRAALLYSASDVEVLTDAQLAAHSYLRRLGPDVLDREVETSDVLERLDDPRFSGRRLAGLLLDQSFLAGLGNYLRSEILHVAGLHPDLRPRDLDGDARRRFAEVALTLPRRSRRTRGTTNDPALAKTLRARGWSRERARFAVFGRDGDVCHACGATIVRDERGSRRIYVCPRCQPPPR
jgi:endonuclease-8